MRVLVPAVVFLLAAGHAQAASFDCAKASHAVEKAICADPALSEKDSRMGRLYRERLALLSTTGQDALRKGQRDWSNLMRRLCASGEESCVERWTDLRLEALGNMGAQKGPFRFSGIDTYAVRAVSGDSPTKDVLPYASTARSFPQIDNEHPAAQRWNAMVRADFGNAQPEPDTDDYLGFSVSFASEKLISVRFDPYVYPHGAAHGMGGASGYTVLLESGRKLAATDLFRPDGQWREFLAKAALADLRKQAKAEDVTLFPEAEKAAQDVAGDPTSWLVSDAGLVLLFQPYEVGPYSFGIREVVVPWDNLRPVLVAGAPVP